MPRTEFWARAIFYNPWVMGGSVWQHKRYKLTGEQVRIWGHQGYVSRVGNGYEVFESVTGGLCGKGKTRASAVKDAIHNIRITPTFKDQMGELGKVENLPEIPTDEALRQLNREKK